MKTLWEPWRMSYILGHAGCHDGCIFDFPDDLSGSTGRSDCHKKIGV